MAALRSLPEEPFLYAIDRYLSIVDLLALRSLNSEFRRLYSSEQCWRSFLWPDGEKHYRRHQDLITQIAKAGNVWLFSQSFILDDGDDRTVQIGAYYLAERYSYDRDRRDDTPSILSTLLQQRGINERALDRWEEVMDALDNVVTAINGADYDSFRIDSSMDTDDVASIHYTALDLLAELEVLWNELKLLGMKSEWVGEFVNKRIRQTLFDILEDLLSGDFVFYSWSPVYWIRMAYYRHHHTARLEFVSSARDSLQLHCRSRYLTHEEWTKGWRRSYLESSVTDSQIWKEIASTALNLFHHACVAVTPEEWIEHLKQLPQEKQYDCAQKSIQFAIKHGYTAWAARATLLMETN